MERKKWRGSWNNCKRRRRGWANVKAVNEFKRRTFGASQPIESNVQSIDTNVQLTGKDCEKTDLSLKVKVFLSKGKRRDWDWPTARTGIAKTCGVDLQPMPSLLSQSTARSWRVVDCAFQVRVLFGRGMNHLVSFIFCLLQPPAHSAGLYFKNVVSSFWIIFGQLHVRIDGLKIALDASAAALMVEMFVLTTLRGIFSAACRQTLHILLIDLVR